MVAEELKVKFDNLVIERGDTRVGIPNNSGQGGSNTTFTHSRAYTLAARDAKAKMLEIAAQDLGGAAADYDIDGEKVFNKADRAKSMTYGQIATRAIALGGKFSGKELPGDINALTKRGAAIVAGTGLVGVAKDTIPGTGTVPGLCAAGLQVEVDLETGEYRLVDYFGVTDCGTVVHPIGLGAQMRSGAIMGFGMAATERFVYDPQNGLPLNMGFHEGKLPTYLDVPPTMEWAAVAKADPQSPYGSRGVGEPAQGCASGALCSAIADALGGKLLNRTPITPDMIINAATGRPQSHKPLAINVQ
jgi:CO/xanthine dehydrogenase Mo-binding subunit